MHIHRRSRLLMALLLGSTLASGSAGFAAAAGNEDNASSSISAKVLKPIDIEKNADLAFGRFIPTPGTPGSVTVNTSGGRSGSSVVLDGGTWSAASFLVTGEPGRSFSITLPPSATVTLAPGGGDLMTVNGFVSSPSSPSSLVNVAGTGIRTIEVGATLQVNAAQTPGAYEGSFPVTVTYQ